MNCKLRLFIRMSLYIFMAFIFLVGASDAGTKKGDEKKTKKTAPEFRYDENSKRYILDTPMFTAEFVPSSLTFIRKKKTGVGNPITFVLEGFYQGGNKLFTSGVMDEPSRRLAEDGKVLIFDRKDYREVYESVERGFLQVYVVNALPSRDKDLILKAKLSTAYSLVPDGEKGYSVKDGDKTITVFKQRVVIDKNSKQLPVKTVLKGDILEITVPKEFLSEAEFPIVIGPPQAFMKKELSDMPSGGKTIKIQPNQ